MRGLLDGLPDLRSYPSYASSKRETLARAGVTADERSEGMDAWVMLVEGQSF